MNPALIERLQAVAASAELAGHGQKNAVYQQAADELGLSLATLRRKLREVVMSKPRKKRADAGNCQLTQDDARVISGYLTSSNRNQGKQLASIKLALEILRSNNPQLATRVNETTGEVVPLSDSAVSRALYQYGLHPTQLAQPSAKQSLASEHPNHCWQIDPSLCVLYYLPRAKGEAIQVMEEKEFYKNKPANIRRIEKERVWRYVITDHASGWVYVHYVLGAESGKNLVEAFIAATQKRHSADPVHGIPRMVMVDPGSANTGAVFTNLCRLLNVDVLVNKPGQPWAKGQVENANNLVERNFEHRLRFLPNPPTCLEEINALAWAWMRWFNQTQVHSRTKVSRYAAWARISIDQLVIAPAAQVMRELAVSKAETRQVTAKLEISYQGKTYSVKDIPRVMVGESVTVARNPWRDDDTAQILYTNDDGREVIQVVEAVTFDEFGFATTAPVIGEEYKAMPDTLADANRKAVERLVMGVDTDEEAEQARKKKQVPFGGAIDPMKPVNDTELVDYLPKRGTESEVVAPTVEMPLISVTQLAMRLRSQLGKSWKPAYMQWLEQRYPQGAREDDVAGIAAQLKQKPQVSTLKVVGEG